MSKAEVENLSDEDLKKAMYEYKSQWDSKGEENWISVEERPLFINTKFGWECTEDGDKPFIAAVPYNDKEQPGKELWWIRHCIVEDTVGLCIVGDDLENIPAGWELKDVTHWMPLPNPPKK